MANGLFGSNIAAPEIRQAQLQPAAVPGSTFVRPQQRETGGNLRALADALGGLNGALQNYGTVVAKEEQDPNSQANKEWIAKRAIMNADQLREEVRLNTPEGNQVKVDALNVLLGEKANDDFRTKWTTFLNTEFDHATGDAAAEYDRIRQETADALPNDLAKAHLYGLTKPHRAAAMQQDVEQKTGYVKEQINDTVVSSFRTSIDDSLNIHGLDPKKAAEIVFAKSASNRDFLGMSGQEQNATIYAIAEEYSLQGNEAMVKALLEGTRTGSDGRTVPPIGRSAAYASKSIALIKRAGDIADAAAEKASLDARIGIDRKVSEGAFTEADAKALEGQHGLSTGELVSKVNASAVNRARAAAAYQAEEQKRQWRRDSADAENRVRADAIAAMSQVGGINRITDVEIPSETGEGTKTRTRKTSIDDATAYFEEQFEAQKKASIDAGMPAEQAIKVATSQRLAFYAGHKLPNPVWENTLNGIAGRATTENLIERGDLTPKLIEDAELYRTLKAANPAYLSTLLTDPKAKEFWDAYEYSVTRGRRSPEASLIDAASMVARDEFAKAKSQVPAKDADDIVNRTLKDLDLDERSFNRTFVAHRVEELSRSGRTTKEIKDEVQREVMDVSVAVHGVLVQDHNDLPDDFATLMEAELQNRFEMFGKELGITDPTDFFVTAESGEGKWLVRSKTLKGSPVGNGSFITPSHLSSQRARKVKADEARALKLIKAKDADKAAAKAEYDADIAAERKRIMRLGAAGGKLGLRMREAELKKLDERIASDKFNIEHSFPERVEEKLKGFGSSAIGEFFKRGAEAAQPTFGGELEPRRTPFNAK
ncbi:MAG: hypothetical protein P0Y66_03770 [Candidatus Kaistia colombiensis]|nr:MAG: hypothetical protein P0Y66_03770 [Kaistia sp.]